MPPEPDPLPAFLDLLAESAALAAHINCMVTVSPEQTLALVAVARAALTVTDDVRALYAARFAMVDDALAALRACAARRGA